MAEADDARITEWALAAKAGDRAAAAAFIRATQQQVHRFLAHLVHAAGGGGPHPGDLPAGHAVIAPVRRPLQRPHLAVLDRSTGRGGPCPDGDRSSAYRRCRRLGTGRGRGPAEAPLRFEEQVELRHLLERLSPERRMAFVATQVLGLSYAEAAEVCGCPIGTVRSRVARAREDLVAALDRAGSPAPGRRVS